MQAGGPKNHGCTAKAGPGDAPDDQKGIHFCIRITKAELGPSAICRKAAAHASWWLVRGRIVAVLAVSDPLKADARGVVAALA